MNRIRPSVLALLVAGLLPTACMGSAPTGPTVSPSVSPNASASLAPSSSPTAETTPSAPAVPSAVPVESTPLRGKVYDDAGAAVPDGSTVKVHSLDSAHPFDTTVETRGGTYIVNGAPVGSALEITAMREGWTSRTRVEVLRTNLSNLDRRNVFNFGGPTDDNDPSGINYFLSSYPEIERVEPADDASSLPNQKMSFKLVMSEPLDVANQRRLASAFMIVPNNQEALADDEALPAETATSTELSGLHAGADPITTSAYRYRQNSGFLNGAEVSEFKWDVDGRTATFNLAAPVKTGNDDEGEYAFLLVQQDDEVIKDKDGKPLGTDDAGDFGRTVKDDVIENAIRETDISLTSGLNDETKNRWNDTHVSYTRFRIAKDVEAPKVVSVIARRNYVDEADKASDRIEITFSEPMIAYPRVADSQLLSLNNYVIAATSTQEEADALKLSDDGSAADIPAGSLSTTARDAIGGTSGGTVGSNASSTNGNYSIALSVKDPKTVILSLPTGALPLDANFIRVLAGSDANATNGAKKTVSDPAGNGVDANQRAATGPIQ